MMYFMYVYFKRNEGLVYTSALSQILLYFEINFPMNLGEKKEANYRHTTLKLWNLAR